MIINPKTIVEKKIIYPVQPEQIQQNGIDIRLDKIWFVRGHGIIENCKTTLAKLVEIRAIRNKYFFSPLRLYKIQCIEQVKIPENMCALIFQRSSLNRCGCNIFTGLFDSGFQGYCGGTLRSFNPISIEQGARIAQIVFMEAQSAKLYKGKYQNK